MVSLDTIGRPGLRKIQAVPSTTHRMLKFPVQDEVVTLHSSTVVPTECRMVAEAPVELHTNEPTVEAGIKVAIHPEYPKHTVTIGGSLSEKGRMKLCDLLRSNLDIFAWKPTNMTGMAEEDEEKIAFHTSQGVFYYTKMPFGLKNVGAKYQRLVDKAFKKQIGRNLEVRSILRPRCQHEGNKSMLGQSRSGHTATIPKEAEGSAKPQWKASKIKQIPIRVRGKIATFLQNSKELHKEKWFPMDDGRRGSIPRNETVHYKTPNAYRSKAKRRVDHVPLCGERSNHRSVNRKRLTANVSLFCQPCTTNSGNQLQLNEKISTRSGAFDVNYRPQTSIYGQILADFIVERPEEDGPPLGIPVEEEIPEPFEFAASNNEAEYEALVAGLRITEQMGVKTKMLISGFKKFSIKQVPRSENMKADALSKIASTNFAHLTKQVPVEVLKEKSIEEKEIIAIVEEE
ncbi:hypothetical protein Tco_1142716 [Tanacetum coccineum]